MTMKKEHLRKVWALVAGVIPIVLSWGLSIGLDYIMIAILLGTVIYMVLFFIKRPCNELVPAIGYAVSFLFIWFVGPGTIHSTSAPLIFDPGFVVRAFINELSASIYHALVLVLYIPISFGLCLITGLILFILRISNQKRMKRETEDFS